MDDFEKGLKDVYDKYKGAKPKEVKPKKKKPKTPKPETPKYVMDGKGGGYKRFKVK